MNEEALFAVAVDQASAAERRAFLDEACGSDAGLRQRVERLLAAHDRAAGILEDGPDASVLTTAPPAPPLVADRPFAGRFRLRQKLGEGGMGEVWVADQAEPVRRRVALKVVRPGLDSARLLARFEQERQALALMDHPNIAKALDAGVTDGRPYFVMELIPGVPITKYCDDAKLSPRERLELFVPVCHAVQHAHQKGVIHRDLKPSNILVALYDGKPVPKVIDFGVAKATGERLTEQSVHTEVGWLIGTLEYMSPEQAKLSNLDVDTRSDVYALGAVLYELLTGSVPFSRTELRAAAFTDMLRLIQEVDPPKPSTKLSGSGKLPSVAAVRQTEPRKLLALVRGELDWIVMKCLEKDRTRRYETANGLAMDLQRYLADEAVVAGPPSAGYRLRKFVRRNRGPVLAATAILLLLVGGIAGTTIGLVRAERARQAEAARAEGERRAKDTAEKRLAQVEKGIDLLGSVFENLDPWAEEKEGRPLRAILGDRLDRAAAELAGEAVGDPLVVARLQDRLGRTYLNLGHAAKAEVLFTKAVTARQAHLGADDPLTLGSRHNQALAYHAAGKPNEAIERFGQVRDARVKVLGPDHLDTLTTLHDLAVVNRLSGKLAEAIHLLEQVRDGRARHLGHDHDHTLATLHQLAGAYLQAGKFTEAIHLLEQVREARVRKHGDDHPDSIAALKSLAYAYQSGFQMKKALDLFEQARDAVVPKLGPDHPLTLLILADLARMYRSYRRTSEAIALGEQVRERQLRVLGGHHPAFLITLNHLALAYQDAGELGKALPLFQQAAAGVESLKFAHIHADTIVGGLYRCHEQLGQYDQAEVWRRECLGVVKERSGPESVAHAIELTGLGSNLLQQKKYADAEPILQESLAVRRTLQPEAWWTFHTQSLLGATLLGQQKYADAEAHLVQGYQAMKNAEKGLGHSHHGPPTQQHLAEAGERLVQLYDAWGKPEEAAKRRQELETVPKP